MCHRDGCGLASNLFLEPHIVACVAVLSRYSRPPARFQVECANIASDWLGKASQFSLEVSWREQTEAKAGRLRATLQSKPLIEIAAVALGLLLAHRVVPLGQLAVTEYGERADYRSVSQSKVLEISGTETVSELGRRHQQKVAQALANPFRWDAYVMVNGLPVQGPCAGRDGHAGDGPALVDVSGFL
jgi:hypothetical protein